MQELLRAKLPAPVSLADVVEEWLVEDQTSDAAELELRNAEAPTAAPTALDADVILAAQALTAGIASEDVVIATTNVGHLSRFMNARGWRDITV